MTKNKGKDNIFAPLGIIEGVLEAEVVLGADVRGGWGGGGSRRESL